MERLTVRDEFGNADILGAIAAARCGSLGYDDLFSISRAVNRLAAYEDTGLEPEEIATRIEGLGQENIRLRKAFALACRILGDVNWQETKDEILDVIDSEAVCRVCGCTWNNACPGGCYWVEEDLCSSCAQEARDHA